MSIIRQEPIVLFKHCSQPAMVEADGDWHTPGTAASSSYHRRFASLVSGETLIKAVLDISWSPQAGTTSPNGVSLATIIGTVNSFGYPSCPTVHAMTDNGKAYYSYDAGNHWLQDTRQTSEADLFHNTADQSDGIDVTAWMQGLYAQVNGGPPPDFSLGYQMVSSNGVSPQMFSIYLSLFWSSP